MRAETQGGWATEPQSLGSPRQAVWGERALVVGVGALALAVYLATMAPGLTFEHLGTDGGDLIAAARTLGVPHPSGYPTFTLLAWLFSYLPMGTIAYRVSLLSAVCAACTAATACATALVALPAAGQCRIIAGAAGLVLAFSPLFWSQAVISEVYALTALSAALVVWLLFRWRSGVGESALWLAALVLGLGLGCHLTLAFVVPAALVWLWLAWASGHRVRFRARAVLPAVALFFAGLAVYAYLPLAAAHRPPVNWGNPQTWGQFVWVVSGRVYQDLVFGLDPAAVSARLSAWSRLLGGQFGWWGLVICLVGGWVWWRRDRPFLLFSLVWALPLAVYAFFYDTHDSQVYLLPVMVLLVLWWAVGAHYLLRLGAKLPLLWQRVALVAVCALPVVSLVVNWRAADLSDEWSAHAYVQEVLAAVAPGGLVVVRGDRPTFALWYGVYGEGQRPDVAVISGPLLAFYWYRDNMRHLYPDLVVRPPPDGDVTTDDLVHALIVDNAGRRAIYATDPSESWRGWFNFVPEGEAPVYRVQPKPGTGDLERGAAPFAIGHLLIRSWPPLARGWVDWPAHLRYLIV